VNARAHPQFRSNTADILDLFDRVAPGTGVGILEHS
jgi:hypothetical protein